MMMAGDKDMVATQGQGSCDEFIDSIMFVWWIHHVNLL